jgi:hypothetical protein
MAAGEHGRRIIAGISSAEIARLLDAQYMKRLRDTKLYVITKRGRQALTEERPQIIAAFATLGQSRSLCTSGHKSHLCQNAVQARFPPPWSISSP